MDDAVERAIEGIWERYDEPLSLAEIASPLSRFYFARIFRNATGITPGRFLAAVRVHQAKRLLVSASMSVAEVSFAVGYNSLGSFSNYFASSVGLSPGRFRRLARTGGNGWPIPEPPPGTGSGAVAGTVGLPEGFGNARVYIGAFRTPIIQHPSAAAVIVDVPSGRPACYHLPDVPEGTWSLLAVGVADGVGPDPALHRSLLVGRQASVRVTRGNVTSAAMRLRRARLIDPPVLLALPDLVPARTLSAVGCAAITPRSAEVGVSG
ncbi:AraC family transcriptional regulator [Actinobacteria bacterium YIM 96077]|uniref:AraC family transcriptional regulator n=1 Tax=Phytoactinopolyspora halophila TaxID=1981511 RepID=A0A329QJD1_9ACTN|nr:AraC family transcriptional regulator [Phytoactinopolyspora halophila]AYY12622.1 AraC family transcriptional regulator [Actinobacteria bacterium YIM 96077]RAW12475.1 AraC family transcriptional regulator [Phytoactinopolyspora halophila]